jgi:hypothetical protein
MLYTWKVRLLRSPRVNALWRRYRRWRGDEVGSYAQLAGHIRHHVRGRSFADIGCMWGVNGEFMFVAEEAGATAVTGVDVFGPTPEFERERTRRGSRAEFVLGDCTDPETIARVGVVDVVFCAGVLYHHPSPFDLLVALRRMCGSLLILRTSTIPEIRGLPNAAVFWPYLAPDARRLWDLRSLGLVRQVGITGGFEPDQGYGNWFWGLTPSCLVSLLRTAGFAVEFRAAEAFAQTVVCTPVAIPFDHRLPDEAGARAVAEAISALGVARPA